MRASAFLRPTLVGSRSHAAFGKPCPTVRRTSMPRGATRMDAVDCGCHRAAWRTLTLEEVRRELALAQ